MKKEYTRDDLTVVWQPELCIHSGVCFRSLPDVFKPRERPWIQLDHGAKEAVIRAVESCPSGALSIKKPEQAGSPPMPADDHQSKVTIMKNGPIRIPEACLITMPDGSEVEKPNGVSLCRCGQSANKPFCDGSHKHNGFSG
jgi:uncharacterized Fe-S cluster protein YjdI